MLYLVRGIAFKLLDGLLISWLLGLPCRCIPRCILGKEHNKCAFLTFMLRVNLEFLCQVCLITVKCEGFILKCRVSSLFGVSFWRT